IAVYVDPTTGNSVDSPIINQSIADTTVNVPNGQTVVIGGMITKNDNTLERKVPWLGDLPVVGKAFRYDSTSISRTELLIFLTPRIVFTDHDAEIIKQVEAERLHFIESDVEELHGPVYSVPPAQHMMDSYVPEYIPDATMNGQGGPTVPSESQGLDLSRSGRQPQPSSLEDNAWKVEPVNGELGGRVSRQARNAAYSPTADSSDKPAQKSRFGWSEK
ncbi:MAG: type II and III secretion system protein, partial [Planctomycetaceae bacterium]|nr:type II and III secretion system protein [Planctomycetaceae bacterium]